MERRLGEIVVVGGIFSIIAKINRGNDLKRATEESVHIWAAFGGPDGESVTEDDIGHLLAEELEFWRVKHDRYVLSRGEYTSEMMSFLGEAQSLRDPIGRRAAVMYFNSSINVIINRLGDRSRFESGGGRDLEFARQITACNTAIALLTRP